jgi:hypothetical protein
MKRKHGIFFGIVVLVIAAMFTMAACGDSGSGDPTSPSGSGGGGGGSSIVGKWYENQGAADKQDIGYLVWEFKANGDAYGVTTKVGTYTISGNKITVTYTGGQFGDYADFIVSGTKLTISNIGTGAFFGEVEGTAYKKSP